MIHRFTRLHFLSCRTVREFGSVLLALPLRVSVRCPFLPSTDPQSLLWASLTRSGRLSLLTEDVVSAAATSGIKIGRRVGLGWDMRKLEFSQFGRQSCQHRIIALQGPGGSGLGACFDDVYEMNPRMFLYALCSDFRFGCPRLCTFSSPLLLSEYRKC
jgi:hypothetical protein